MKRHYTLATNYMDPHKEGTFTYAGNTYYVSQLYGKPMKILSSTVFFPIGAKASGLQNVIFASGNTYPVYSSSTYNGKTILLFDIPGIPGSDAQYFAYLDTSKLVPTGVLTTRADQDTHEKKVNADINTTVEVSKMDFWEQLLNSFFPGNSYLWIKKNGKWVLLTGAGLLAYKLFFSGSQKQR